MLLSNLFYTHLKARADWRPNEGSKGRGKRGPGQYDRKIKLEFARPALSAWGRGDNPGRGSPAQNIPLNLLRMLTPPPASLLLRDLLTTTWCKQLGSGRCQRTRRAIVQPSWKETGIPAPPHPTALCRLVLTSSFFLFSSFTSVFLISALKASASPFWSSLASRSMR